IRHALAEDLGERGDITTQALFDSGRIIDAEMLVKQNGVLCGLDVAIQVFHEVHPGVTVEKLAEDAQKVAAGAIICRITGRADALITAERTALNFIGRLSGVATLTRLFVDRVAGTSAKILDTRKTTPGWRRLEKYAVACGGGVNHRMGLYDLFLIKDNHIAAAGGIAAAVAGCREYMRRNRFTASIEVETKTLEELEQALALDVDRIMLDNMPLALMRRCVQRVNQRVPLEASGGVSLETVRAIAETGVDFISIGALTHSAPVLDISLEVIPEQNG
nr:carboxylating nicotinate-nucleotide diphosphorylase [bacterium]